MNFLAHAYLSGGAKKILVGNMTGDFIKGRIALSRYEPEIVRGVELHRAIDAFTDEHPIVRGSKARLRAGYRHYAGVIVDVFYDHYLATDWSSYHEQSLHAFTANTYETLQSFSAILPADFRRMLPYMMRGNWLFNYRSVDGIHRALSGMASRTPYASRMEHASKDLEENYELFRQEFREFFPELKNYCHDWLRYSTPHNVNPPGTE